MKVVAATRNPGKLELIRLIFAGSAAEILTPDEVGVAGAAAEDGLTFEENAFQKADYVRRQLAKPLWVMADDGGICIVALNGAPGVHSARWAGGGKTTEEIMNHTLERLQGISDRRATFVTVVVLLSPTGERFTFQAKVQGKILQAPRVPPKPGLPYSAIFLADGRERTFAEMTPEAVSQFSSHGEILRQARRFLERGSQETASKET